MNTNLSATELRRWAAQCEARAKDTMTSGQDYDRLMLMRDGLRAVAEQQEWLDGIAMQKTG